MDTENTNVNPETDEIPEESVETSETEQDTSEKETEQTEEATPKPEKTEKPGKEEPKEEPFDAKVKRLAQSIKDKELKPVYKELEDLRKQNKELTTQVTEKTWDRNIANLFDEEKESLGEDEAAQKKAARESVKKQVLEFQQNQAYVKKMKPELEAKETALGLVERDQKAREDIWKLLFPEDGKQVDQVAAVVKKFDKATDWDAYEMIFEGIKETIKSKVPKYTPDSGRTGASGKDTSKMSPDEKINEGFKILMKKK